MAKDRVGRRTSRSSPVNNQKLDEERLQGIEDEWLAERIRGESESTQRLLDDDYQGSTSSGAPQTKADFVNAVNSARRDFENYLHTERNIKIHGDTAISTGVATLRASDRLHSFRYLRVFLRKHGEWRLIASQSTPFQIPT